MILTLVIVFHPALGQKIEPMYRDNSVNEIKLRTPETVEKVLGQGKKFVDQNDHEMEVANGDGKQLLTLISYPGGTTNEFYAFRVEYNTNHIKTTLKIETKDFVTGRHIKLGLTENQVKSKLGAPSETTSENGLKIWNYKSKDEDDLYFGRYAFKDAKLIQFWFGDEYP